jgi:predicted CXXCH cytochrome family protein
VWSNSFAQNNNGSNNLGNCIRCHDGQGYVNFTKGIGTNTNGKTVASHEMVSCSACHDPHGSSNPYQLRSRPQGSDTLANGYHYTGMGNGATCMDCHKSRQNSNTYVNTRVTNSNWGPHYGTEGDIYLGQTLQHSAARHTGQHSILHSCRIHAQPAIWHLQIQIL